AQFQKDRLDARDEADKLKFSFDREHQLSLHEYLTKKAHLLEDAGFQDEDEVVYRIWRGLDPILMNAIQLSHRDNSFSNFTLTLYHQEYPAHLLWRTQNRQKEARRYDSTAHASPFRPSMFQGQRPPE